MALRLATGYMVLSGKVMAFKKVLSDPLTNSTNGSFKGNFRDPHKVECSQMWGTPVLLSGVVRKDTEKTLLSSSLAKYKSLAPDCM